MIRQEVSEKITAESKVGMIGFVCPDGEKRTFDFCIKECRNRCKYPFPLLLALMSDRKVVPNSYSVTEILNPPRIVYYTRNFTYFAAPKSLIWQTFGSAWHNIIDFQKTQIKDLGLEDEYLIEESFEKIFTIQTGEIRLNHQEIEPVKLRGRSDLYCTSTKTLWDFKTMKQYPVQKAWKRDWSGSTYPMQLNIYRVYQYPEAEKIMISAIIKDHSRGIEEKYGMEPVERLEVPIIPDLEVKETVKELLKIHVENQEDPSKIRQCTNDELWINKKGERLRCMEYCPVKDLCPQWKEYNERINIKRKAKR